MAVALALVLTPCLTLPAVAATPRNLVTIRALIADGHYADAEEAARRSLSQLEAGGTTATDDLAGYLDGYVEALLRGGKGKRPEALDSAQESVHLMEALHGPQSIQAARSLERLGRVLTRRLDFPAAEDVLKRSLRALEETDGHHEAAIASVNRSIGQLACLRGDFASATASLERALSLDVQVLGRDHPKVAETLRIMGECDLSQLRLDAASRSLQRSREILQTTVTPGHPELALTLTQLGQVMIQTGRFEDANRLLHDAATMLERTQGSRSPLVVLPLERLAALHTELGQFSTAAEIFQRILAIERAEFGPSDLATLGTLRSFAVLRAKMGSYEEAADLLGEVAQQLALTVGTRHPDFARALQNRGAALSQAGKYAEGRALLLEALDIWIQQLGPDNVRVAACMMNVGSNYRLSGDPVKAREYQLRALEVVDRLPASDPGLRGGVLNNLAGTTRDLGDLPEALRLISEARIATERVYGRAHPEVWRVMHNQAQLLIESGRVAEGLAVTVDAEVMSREHLALTARTASEYESLTMAAVRGGFLDVLTTLAVIDRGSEYGTAWTAWDNVLRARGLIVDELITRRKVALATYDPTTAALKEQMDSASERLSRLVLAGPGGSSPAEFEASLAVAREARRSSEKAFAARNQSFREMLSKGATGLPQIIAALPQGHALVAYVRYQHYDHLDGAVPPAVKRPWNTAEPPRYVAFVVTPDLASPHVFPLGDADQIDQLIGRWRKAASREALAVGMAPKAGEADYRRVATELRRIIWDPVAPLLAGATGAFLVPDGAISLVNFAALPVGNDGYLVEHVPRLHYLSSERDLLPGEDSPRQSGGLLALSDPAFDDRTLFAALNSKEVGESGDAAAPAAYRGKRSGCKSFGKFMFEPLPASKKEAGDLVSLWTSQSTVDADVVQAFAGASASESALKRNASGKRVLHLATHGFFLGGHCGSALDPTMAAVTRENPLVMSGLVLAGANYREAAGPDEDDGILTAEEIATLDLRGTDWAVLSACDTGMGEIRSGEGVFGLRRAFQLAGARTVIMSLWPVEDESTRQWMSALYRHRLAEHESTIESVNHASLELLRQRRARGESTHPFYWAGFIAAGDWR